LSLQNLIGGGPGDDLLGDFLFALGSFGQSGFSAVDLAPDAQVDGLHLSFTPTAAGTYNGTFTFTGRSHNAFQDDLALASIQFNLHATVLDGQGNPAPEPGTLALLLLGALGATVARAKTRKH